MALKKGHTKRKLLYLLIVGLFFAPLLWPSKVLAASPSDIATFTSQTVSGLALFAGLATVVFLILGSYLYITSSGKPEQVENAKRTISKALIGLLLVLGSTAFISILQGFLTIPAQPGVSTPLALSPIVPTQPSEGLTQVLLDSISGLLRNVIESATKPLTDAILFYVTTTPSILANSVIFNFWLTMVGIADTLFVLVVALLGLQVMSASTFGFEELDLKQVLLRVGIAFLGANTSIFLIEWLIQLSNTLVGTVLQATGGIEKAWLFTAFDPAVLFNSALEVALITLIFMVLFLVLTIVLLLFFISRLILVALGAVLAPFVFLLWASPKGADFAEVSIKTYFVTIFSVFVQIIIIQLASAFLTIDGQVGTNPLISILVGVGLLLVLLKTPGTLSTFVFYTTSSGMLKNLAAKLVNTASVSNVLLPRSPMGEVIAPRRKIEG